MRIRFKVANYCLDQMMKNFKMCLEESDCSKVTKRLSKGTRWLNRACVIGPPEVKNIIDDAIREILNNEVKSLLED